MRDLIKRIEAASEGSRALDWEIHLHDGLDGKGMYGSHPHYSTSIDAAITLVPEGWWHGYMTSDGGFAAHCFEQIVDCAVFRATLVTPALALCAAALKARSDCLARYGEDIFGDGK